MAIREGDRTAQQPPAAQIETIEEFSAYFTAQQVEYYRDVARERERESRKLRKVFSLKRPLTPLKST